MQSVQVLKWIVWVPLGVCTFWEKYVNKWYHIVNIFVSTLSLEAHHRWQDDLGHAARGGCKQPGVVVDQPVQHHAAVLVRAVRTVAPAVAALPHVHGVAALAVEHVRRSVQVERHLLEGVVGAEIIAIYRPGAGAWWYIHCKKRLTIFPSLGRNY